MINRFFNIIIDTTLNLLDTSKCMNFKLQSNNPLNPNRSGFYIGVNFFSYWKWYCNSFTYFNNSLI